MTVLHALTWKWTPQDVAHHIVLRSPINVLDCALWIPFQCNDFVRSHTHVRQSRWDYIVLGTKTSRTAVKISKRLQNVTGIILKLPRYTNRIGKSTLRHATSKRNLGNYNYARIDLFYPFHVAVNYLSLLNDLASVTPDHKPAIFSSHPFSFETFYTC